MHTVRTTRLRPLDEDNFVWSTLDELLDIQAVYEAPVDADQNEDGMITISNCIWVPSEAKDLIQRMCVEAHCGAQDHRGQQSMVSHLRRLFTIEHLCNQICWPMPPVFVFTRREGDA